MARIAVPDLGGVSQTLLVPLAYRAAESLRPDALVRDEKAVELVRRIDYDFRRLRGSAFDQLTAVMRTREFDRAARAFMAQRENAVVVDIGCGLDTRFHRLDDGRVRWYDLDLPEVIALRRELLEETARCRMIACSALDLSWLELVAGLAAGSSYLLLAEGVFPYLAPEEVKCLVLALAERFPGAQLVFDGLPRFMQSVGRLELLLRGIRAPLRWGMRDGREPEAWGPGIRLVGEWHYFDQPEPRLGVYRLLRWLPPFAKGFRVVRYRLGECDPPGPANSTLSDGARCAP